MGKSKDREYIENIAQTLMGQLDISDDAVGVDNYHHDVIAAGVRKRTFNRVFQDLRHMTVGTLAGIVSCGGIIGVPGEQEKPEQWELLHNGKTPCTLNHVHYRDRKHWLDDIEHYPPSHVIRHMAATVIVAAMYDLVVAKKQLVPAASTQ